MNTMLTVIPQGWFTPDFNVMEESRLVATTEVSWWRERGRLVIEGMPYNVFREEPKSGDFFLEIGGTVLVRAEQSGLFRTSFIIEHAGKQYTLRAKSLFRRAVVLLDGSKEVGLLSPEGLYGGRVQVTLPGDLPLPAKVFIIWLAAIRWHREAESS